MMRQAGYGEPQRLQQPWRSMGGLHLALVLSVDPTTGTCGVELSEGSQPVPASIMAPNANASSGWIWLPQVNDLVVVGFLEKNSSMPVILGSLYAANDTLHNLNEGDMTLLHKTGSKLKVANDGAVTLTQQAGAAVTMDTDGDVHVTHATSGAEFHLDTNGADLKHGSVRAHVGTDNKILLEGGGGASVEITAAGAVNVTPGPGHILTLAGGGNFVARAGDVTSSPFGDPVPDHYHILIATSTKVYAG